MSNTNNEQNPVFCVNGCGFYGNPSTKFLCSKCFRDDQLKQKAASAAASVSAGSDSSVVAASSAASSAASVFGSSTLSSNASSSTTNSSSTLPHVPSIVVEGSGSSNSSIRTGVEFVDPLPSSSPSPSISSLSPSPSPSPSSSSSSTSSSSSSSIASLSSVSSSASSLAIPIPGSGGSARSSSSSADGVSPSSSPSDPSPLALGTSPTKESSRCQTCQKKVGLLGFKCKCNGTFCSKHRYPDEHQCSFDFKSSAREQLSKDNPVVKANKLQRI